MRPSRWRSRRRTTTRPKERSHAQLPRQLVQRRSRPGDGHRRRPRALASEALAPAVVLGPEPRGVDGPPVRGVRLPGLLPWHFNAGVFKSEKPDRYPLNTNSSLIVNAVVG